MRQLASYIAAELRTAKHCAVYEPELSRVWPEHPNREKEIATFAEKHGWRLRFYQEGLCAIFDKDPEKEEANTGSRQNRVLQ